MQKPTKAHAQTRFCLSAIYMLGFCFTWWIYRWLNFVDGIFAMTGKAFVPKINAKDSNTSKEPHDTA